MKPIVAGALEVAYLKRRPADGPSAILLHGVPYNTRAFDAASSRCAFLRDP